MRINQILNFCLILYSVNVYAIGEVVPFNPPPNGTQLNSLAQGNVDCSFGPELIQAACTLALATIPPETVIELCQKALNAAAQTCGQTLTKYLRGVQKEPMEIRQLRGACNSAGWTCDGSDKLFCKVESRTHVSCGCYGGYSEPCEYRCDTYTEYWYEEVGGTRLTCQFGDFPCRDGRCIEPYEACSKADVFTEGFFQAGKCRLLSNATQSDCQAQFGDQPIISIGQKGIPVGFNTWATTNPAQVRRDALEGIVIDFASWNSNLKSLSQDPRYRRALDQFLQNSRAKNNLLETLAQSELPECINDSAYLESCVLSCETYLARLRRFFKQCSENLGESTINSEAVLGNVDCYTRCSKNQHGRMNSKAQLFDNQFSQLASKLDRRVEKEEKNENYFSE